MAQNPLLPAVQHRATLKALLITKTYRQLPNRITNAGCGLACTTADQGDDEYQNFMS